MRRLRAFLRRDTLRKDAVAGVVLGGQSVPDGLAGGLLADINPVFGQPDRGAVEWVASRTG